MALLSQFADGKCCLDVYQCVSGCSSESLESKKWKSNFTILSILKWHTLK